MLATGGWQNWTTVSVPLALGAGTQQMTLTADTAGFNIDSIAIGASSSGGGGSTPPPTVTVAMSSPSIGATYVAPATISLGANATTTSGTISKVDFFNGSTPVGSDTTAPYAGTWSNVPAGTYSIVATSTTSGGVTATSAAVTVTVTSAPPPPPPPPTPPPVSGGLVQQSNLAYVGSFKVPHAGTLQAGTTGRGFDYGGRAPAFNPPTATCSS